MYIIILCTYNHNDRRYLGPKTRDVHGSTAETLHNILCSFNRHRPGDRLTRDFHLQHAAILLDIFL